MNRKQYPLHPGQTHVEPMYTQVPTEDYETLKREARQLREITKGSRTTVDDIAEIKTLTSEVKALREMNARAQARITELERMDTEHTIQIAKMNGYISTLEDSYRWRKCSEELPTDETEVPVILYNDWKTTDYFEKDKDRWHYHWDNVAYWFLTPKAPEVK